MIQNLKKASLTDLLDMLSAYTSVYMKMLMRGATKEQFYKCKREIIQIQKELEARKTLPDTTNNNVTGTDIPYTQDYTN